jgi:hypothetical protein
LTVVSFRGSTAKFDFVLDAQFFLFSVLLGATSLLTDIFELFPATQNAIQSIMAAALTMMRPFTLLNSFLTNLDTYHELIPDKDGDVLFVGHSLGGALAKLFGHMYSQQSVVLSGPGIRLYQDLFRKSRERRLNILLTQANIVPDRDIVPRIDTSGGVRYSVPCRAGPFTCHGKWRSVCMIDAMGNAEHEEFCGRLKESGGYRYSDLRKEFEE